MPKAAQRIFRTMSYILFAIIILFYIVLLRAPIPFLLGTVAGLLVYGGCYIFIRIGWSSIVRWLMLTLCLSLFIYALYSLSYVLQNH